MANSKPEKPFEYFDSPDGHDILKKFGVILKPLCFVAVFCSTADVLLWSKPKTYLGVAGRFLQVSWPIFGIATAFVLGHNVAGSLRKTDDKINWFIGGAAAGTVYGVWRKNARAGMTMAGFGGSLAAGKKFAQENGTFMLVPDTHNAQIGSLRSVRQDWSITSERPRNWTTGVENK